ncbi:MAG: hypothetical protein DME37_06435, partial [Verrucomicrobia bacterium]
TAEKILIINIARTFQPKQDHMRNLAGAGGGSLCTGRCKRECDAGQKHRDAHTEAEQGIHLRDQYRRSKPAARHQN